SLDDMVPERRLLRAMTMVLSIGLALFCLTVFPMRRPRFLNIRFRPDRRSLPRSPFERNLASFKAGNALNYALPASLLRDEFERHLMGALYPEGGGPGGVKCYLPATIRELSERYGRRLSQDPRAQAAHAETLAALLRRFAKVPVNAQVFL